MTEAGRILEKAACAERGTKARAWHIPGTSVSSGWWQFRWSGEGGPGKKIAGHF